MRCGILGAIVFALAAQSAPAPPRDVEGRVIHAVTKAPLRGAIVLASSAERQASAAGHDAFLTGADGRFLLRPSVSLQHVLITKTGFLDTRVPVGSPDRGESVAIPLTPAASITGRVLDPAGDPVRAAAVRVAIKGETLEAKARLTTTDDLGRYVIDALPAGEYVLTAGRTGGDTMTRPHPYPAAATVAIGEERDGVDLHVPWESDAETAFLRKADQTRSTADVNAGTASIAGTVRNRQGRGAANIYVSARRTADPPGTITRTWSAVTDERGTFVIETLPAGTFSVIAHLRTVGPPYGTTPVSLPTTQIELADGQRRSDVNLTLRDGGVIAGVIRDEFGDPVRATVTLLAASESLGIATSASRTTDQRGRYRFADLPPNRYLVMAMRATPSPVLAGDGSGQSRLVGSAPYFYPGVPSIELATVVSTAIGSAFDTADMTVAYEPVADVDVSLVAAAAPVVKLEARHHPLHGRLSSASSGITGGAGVTFGGVTAGHWLFTVAATLDTPNGPEKHWAVHQAATDGLTRHSTTLTLDAPARVSGTIASDAGVPPPEFIWLTYIGQALSAPPIRSSASTTPDGTFEFRNVMPGAYAIEVGSIPGATRTLARATANGRDILDLPIQLQPAAELSGVVLTVTNRTTELSGVVTDASGRRVTETELIVVAADPKYHWRGSRRLRRIVTGADGTYTVRGLPPGEYRVGLAPRALTGAALMEFPRPIPTLAVKLADGERRIQNLIVSR